MLYVELEFPDGGRPIEACLNAEPFPILAELETRRDQGVLGYELGLTKGCGSGHLYGYGPNCWGGVRERVVSGPGTGRPLGDEKCWSLSSDVALAIVGQETKLGKGIITLVIWCIRLGGVDQRGLGGRKRESGELLWGEILFEGGLSLGKRLRRIWVL